MTIHNSYIDLHCISSTRVGISQISLNSCNRIMLRYESTGTKIDLK